MVAKKLEENQQQNLENNNNNNNKRVNNKQKKPKKPRIRVFPIWLRVIVVIILAAAALTLGLMFGYGIIGDGDATDVLKKETWQHILDIISKEE